MSTNLRLVFTDKRSETVHEVHLCQVPTTSSLEILGGDKFGQESFLTICKRYLAWVEKHCHGNIKTWQEKMISQALDKYGKDYTPQWGAW